MINMLQPLAWIFLMTTLNGGTGDAAIRMIDDHKMQVTLTGEPLDHHEVARHLASGLTTSFRLTIGGKGGSTPAAVAAIGVRYELWDEVYLVRYRAPNGIEEELSFATLIAFKDWWRDLAIICDAPDKASRGPIKVTLEVIPFSRSERADARKWLSRSLAGDEGASTKGISAESLGNSILSTIVATSIRQKVLLSFDWTLAVVE